MCLEVGIKRKHCESEAKMGKRQAPSGTSKQHRGPWALSESQEETLEK